MDQFWFWKQWPNPQRNLIQALLAVLAVAFVFYLVAYFWESRSLIEWETISQIKGIPLPLDQIQYFGIPLNVEADFYSITQTFNAGDIQLKAWPAYLFLSLIVLATVVALSLAVDLGRFWYIVSQIVFIFMLVGFKLEQLLLFDRTDKLGLIIAFVLYIPLGYYFHSATRKFSIIQRLLAFSTVTAVFALVIYFFSGVSKPFLYLVNYGIAVPVVASLVFIIFTAHEMIFGFLALITRNNTPKSSNSFAHFFAISLIYLTNVLLLYLKNSRRIDWDFYYLDAFWILAVTTMVGFWGMRIRRERYENIVPFKPHAAAGYLLLAAVCFGTIGYFFATANDPIIETLEDAIVFSQLCIGFMFLLYILFNFRTLLIENLKVYKVVYKPQKMPFFTMRIGGLIGVLGLFLLANQYPLDQAITGYYNGIGDLHRADGKNFLAQEYYKLAAIYASTNHRSNYAIGALAMSENRYSEALKYFKQSTQKQPTPFAYVNTANLYQAQGSFFQALFTLKEGLKEFPENGHILNNLAMLYSQTDIIDSAFYFLDRNQQKGILATTTNTNRLALLMRTPLQLPIDSLFKEAEPFQAEEQSNLLLYASRSGYTPQQDFQPPMDSVLNPLWFSWWYNRTLNAKRGDTTYVSFLRKISNKPENAVFDMDLKFAAAVSLYYSGDVKQAFTLLNNLQFLNSSKSGFYNHILGIWSLQQHAPRLAKDYFQRALESDHLPSLTPQALTLWSLGEYDQSKRLWHAFLRSDPEMLPVHQHINDVLYSDQDSLSNQDYRVLQNLQQDQLSWQSALAGIQDVTLKQQAIQVLLNRYSLVDNSQALQALTRFTDREDLKSQLSVSLASGGQAPSDTQSLTLRDHNWVTYNLAQQALQQQDTAQATSHFHKLAANPFFVPGVLKAAAFFSESGADDHSYQVLLESMTVNRYEPQILAAYGKQCVRMNLDTYAQVALQELRSILPEDQWDGANEG